MAEKDFRKKPYYDILIMGKTGQGKSTAGNMLLDNPSASATRIVDVLYNLRNPVEKLTERPLTKFKEGATDLVESCTTRPDVLHNPDTNIRVFDTKGFADSNLKSGLSSFTNNLGVMRSILLWQSLTKMSFSRVLYFLPYRGSLEKIDGNLQEEIEIMLHFFGLGVFNCMVLVFTLNADAEDGMTPARMFGQRWESKTKTVMLAAIRVTAERLKMNLPENFRCPPMVFIPKAESSHNVITAVKQAEVIVDKPYQFAFRKTICPKCAGLLKFPPAAIAENPKINMDISTDPVSVTYDNNDSIEFARSMCHPSFVSKYSLLEIVVGSAAHILSLGLVRLAEVITGNDYLPFFGNSEEVCVACKEPPSESRGCMKVNSKWTTESSKQGVIIVKHSRGTG